MTDFPIPITAWTAVILGCLFLWLTFRVILHRRRERIVLGDNDDRVLTKKIRGHGNAAEQIPMALILLGMAEVLMPVWITAALAVLLMAGRFSHGLYFAIHGLPHQMRSLGMMATTIATGSCIVAVAVGLLI